MIIISTAGFDLRKQCCTTIFQSCGFVSTFLCPNESICPIATRSSWQAIWPLDMFIALTTFIPLLFHHIPPGGQVWVALGEKVPNVLSRCHTKRRMGAPFFWYDTDFLDYFWKKRIFLNFLNFFFRKIGVIPKEGRTQAIRDLFA